MSGVAAFLKGECTEVMRRMRDNCVDCIVTSPPYYRKRGKRETGTIDQRSVEGFVHSLVLVFREAARVLKPTGSLWLNLGDTYQTRRCC